MTYRELSSRSLACRRCTMNATATALMEPTATCCMCFPCTDSFNAIVTAARMGKLRQALAKAAQVIGDTAGLAPEPADLTTGLSAPWEGGG